MDKSFLESWTFWGSVALGLSMALESLGGSYAWALTAGKALAAFLIPFGLRRALK